jgi:hypothetical protein
MGSAESGELNIYVKLCMALKTFWNYVGVPGCKLTWLSHDKECMVRGDEDFVRKKVIFNCSSSCCMSSYTSL